MGTHRDSVAVGQTLIAADKKAPPLSDVRAGQR